MRNPQQPSDRQELLDADADADARSCLRERVRQHLRKMAPLALIAAPPLLTAQACDPAPVPACEDTWGSWKRKVSVRAVWGEDNGSKIVILDVASSEERIQPPASYSIVGGSILTSGKSSLVKIKPDAGAEHITLSGQLECGTYGSEPIRITIDLVPPTGSSAAAPPTVTVS
jgi:hypothetical protein